MLRLGYWKLTDSIALALVAQTNYTATSVFGAVKQLGFAKSIKIVTGEIKKQIPWLTAAGGKITLIAVAALATMAIITSATDAWQKTVEEAQESLKTHEENIQKYQSELDSLEQLQKKLEEAQGDKKALAVIQGELNDAIGETAGLLNGEAEAYKIATVNLQAQTNAKKKLIFFISSLL